MIRPRPTFGVIGLNFKTTKLAVLEQLSIQPDQQVWLLKQLAVKFGLNQLVLLSTCNRVELYYGQDQGVVDADAIFQSLVEYQNIRESSDHQVYKYQNTLAVEHLLKVAAGLDSMILGELQIAGQVKLALQQSFKHKLVSGFLAQVFHLALGFSKKIRTQFYTGSQNSISHLAVQWLQNEIEDLKQQSILLVGAGKMAKLVLQQLQSLGVKNITCISRNTTNAVALTPKQHLKWPSLQLGLAKANVVIAATSASQVILGEEQIKTCTTKSQTPLWLVDIGMPRNIEPTVAKFPKVTLANLDSLHQFSNTAEKNPPTFLIEPFLHEAIQNFNRWLAVWRIGPLIKNMRQQWQIEHGGLTNQQLHHQTMQIKQWSINNQLNLNDPQMLPKIYQRVLCPAQQAQL